MDDFSPLNILITLVIVVFLVLLATKPGYPEDEVIGADASPDHQPRTPCEFLPNFDSCQATAIERCGYCGHHKGNPCGKESADISYVTAYHHGNLAEEAVPTTLYLISQGVQPFPHPSTDQRS